MEVLLAERARGERPNHILRFTGGTPVLTVGFRTAAAANPLRRRAAGALDPREAERRWDVVMWLAILLICVVLAVATVVAIVYGASRWEVGTKAIRAQLRSARVPITPATYDARELEGLPPPVQRYFRAVLTDGQSIVGRRAGRA